MIEVVDSIATLLLARLVPGETPINIQSTYMNMTLASNRPDNLLSEPLTLGDAQLTLPSDWCDIAPPDVDCSSREPVSVKVHRCPLLSPIHTSNNVEATFDSAEATVDFVAKRQQCRTSFS